MSNSKNFRFKSLSTIIDDESMSPQTNETWQQFLRPETVHAAGNGSSSANVHDAGNGSSSANVHDAGNGSVATEAPPSKKLKLTPTAFPILPLHPLLLDPNSSLGKQYPFIMVPIMPSSVPASVPSSVPATLISPVSGTVEEPKMAEDGEIKYKADKRECAVLLQHAFCSDSLLRTREERTAFGLLLVFRTNHGARRTSLVPKSSKHYRENEKWLCWNSNKIFRTEEGYGVELEFPNCKGSGKAIKRDFQGSSSGISLLDDALWVIAHGVASGSILVEKLAELDKGEEYAYEDGVGDLPMFRSTGNLYITDPYRWFQGKVEQFSRQLGYKAGAVSPAAFRRGYAEAGFARSGGNVKATLKALGHSEDESAHVLKKNYFHGSEPSCPRASQDHKVHQCPCTPGSKICLDMLLKEEVEPSTYDVACPVHECDDDIKVADRDGVPVKYDEHLWCNHGIVPYGYIPKVDQLNKELGPGLRVDREQVMIRFRNFY